MSAIAGILTYSGEPVTEEESRPLLEQMERLRADRTGIWKDGGTFFLCRIRELTPEARFEELPRRSEAGDLAITADAILDNRERLFEELMIEPSRRKSIPDSELILLAYRKWGDDAPSRLNGDFAFVLWDKPRHRLFGARDHSGKRTLYFHQTDRRFAFSTLLRPLLALPGADKRLNEEWLAEYLAVTGMVDSADASTTVYRDIRQLPPASRFVLEEGRLAISAYDSFLPQEPLRLKSDEEYEEAFRAVLDTAVRSRLRSHLPVGAQLSGGLDSGSVASFAARSLGAENRTLHTFSFVPAPDFEDWTARHLMPNESEYMKATASKYPNIEPSFHDFAGKNPLTEVDDWLELMEMPYKFFENSYWMKGIHEKAAERGIGVLFNGGRGNFTVSWGPAIDYYSLLLRRFQLVRLAREASAYSRIKGVHRSRVWAAVRQKAFPALARNAAAAAGSEDPQWIHPDFAARTGVFERIAAQGYNVNGSSTLRADNAIEARTRHFEHANIWHTNGTTFCKLSQRFGVQGYDPTSDARVIRFCLSLPLDQFVRDGSGRALIRRATRGILADEVRLNQRVRGIQSADWLHRMLPAWKETAAEFGRMAQDPVMQAIVRPSLLKRALAYGEETPQAASAFDLELRLLMRSLILYRFLHKTA
ncbi:asparagine synthase-related protein [Gorillibacterium sp. sgz500922]|uniref:asparagine synthase-related protein n=1 Tax=Gorillibacterium sp. sgz500922 TaxID=3446694 RepID=UPI003F66C988